MLYLETSALVAYTLTRERERQRYEQMAALTDKIRLGEIEAATSFYALIELYTIALKNATDARQGMKDGTDVLVEILQTGLTVLPMLARQEKLIYGRHFRHMKDSTDVSHAVSAYRHHCEAIITFDTHFQAVADLIPCRTPVEFFARQ